MIPKPQKPHKDDIEIPVEDIELIMDKQFKNFDLIKSSCFCARCEPHTTTITNYKAYLSKLNDIILKGECIRCQGPTNRVIETGEKPEMAAFIKHIRTVVKKYRK